MDFFTLIAQAIFVYFLLWWVAFPSLLSVNLRDFTLGLPWRKSGKWVLLCPWRVTHTIGKKAVVACFIALAAWLIVFPIVQSDAISFQHFADDMATTMDTK